MGSLACHAAQSLIDLHETSLDIEDARRESSGIIISFFISSTIGITIKYPLRHASQWIIGDGPAVLNCKSHKHYPKTCQLTEDVETPFHYGSRQPEIYHLQARLPLPPTQDPAAHPASAVRHSYELCPGIRVRDWCAESGVGYASQLPYLADEPPLCGRSANLTSSGSRRLHWPPEKFSRIHTASTLLTLEPRGPSQRTARTRKCIARLALPAAQPPREDHTTRVKYFGWLLSWAGD